MLQDKVISTINKYKLIKKGDYILLGVSGGPDSVALAYILNSLKKRLGIKLCIGHLDHAMREYSHKDAYFVRSLAQKLGIPFFFSRVRVNQAYKEASEEQNARSARFSFFLSVAKKENINKIALGHNFDDQAETVLMRILRGAGLYGMLGIMPKREISGHVFIRPLIDLKRKEIIAYLKKKKIRFCIDPSNAKNIYFRNSVRNELLPLLESKYNKNIKERLNDMADSIAYDYDYLMRSASRFLKRQGQSLQVGSLIRLHPSIRRLALRLSIHAKQGDIRRITFNHIQELDDLIINRPDNSIVDLPKGLYALKKRGKLYFRNKY
ncbi:MAG: tRNA lysidine(34) synthetase TilS [Candidatus Omnitrophota bacterium]|jgi:tRNA(Ile)-lysidine synthase|nr:MAG: tRNA lysidine(34) synthetase TilS [Candidatus Omnitrophota bacterium]